MLCSFGAGYILAGVYLIWGIDQFDPPKIVKA
jgi:hypothetical protein